ncbi:hypothetical protein LJC52_04125 [Bacteroidales bacterium OttesenSCG-928-A17]|nr:hypothetical protein [Bacteroidales bacterium OttesenSCG-928-A17]
MKKTIINILLFLSLALPTISQTEVQQENITLNTAVSGTHTYTASETVSLKPGFSYKATGNDVFQAKIDQTLLFPPSGNTYADAEGNIVSSPSQGAVVGSIPGAFDVSPTGAATYTVPIECLPGINGMQPNISLVYNSQSGNGIAGMCWSIGGLSMISRTGKNFYFDTDKSGIIWDNTSPFALDGQRLLEIQRWERGAITDSIEYRTESGLDKIMAYDIASWGPLYFIVYTKEGSVIQYGNTADIASYFPLKARYRRKLDISTELWNLGWAITQIRDKNGNYLNFNYSCDLEGTTITNNISYNNYSGSWISSIEYAHETQSISPRNTSPRPSGVVAEKIVFNYQPNISPITTYLDGLTMSNKYILDAIEIQDKTNVVHFTYNLSYEIRDNNYFLQEIKKTNAQGEFFHPIEFEWNDPSYTFSEVAKMAIEAPPSYLEYKNNQNYDMSEFHIQYGNINDDGIQDIVARYTYKKGDTEKFYMGIFLKSGNRYVYAYEKELINHEVFFLYDVDMDGIDDVIMGSASKLKIGTLDSYRYNITQHTYDTVNSELTLIENLAIIFVSSSVYDDRKKLQLIPGDFLGNGELQYLLMNGNKIISFINSFYFGITLDIGGDVYSQVFVTDINGNGKGEIMYFNGNQGNGNQRMTFYEYDTEDQTFKSIESISLGVKVIQIIPVDINGDGNTDIALKRDSNGKYLSFLSDGKNLISSDILSGFPDGSTAAFVDVNEDGKIDAIVNENIRDSNDAIISKSSIYINIGNEFVNKYSVNNSTLDVSTVSSPGKYGTTVGKGILTKKYYNTSNVDYFTVCSNIQFNKIKK